MATWIMTFDVWFMLAFLLVNDARELDEAAIMLPGLQAEMKAFVNDEGKELSLLSRCKSK